MPTATPSTPTLPLTSQGVTFCSVLPLTSAGGGLTSTTGVVVDLPFVGVEGARSPPTVVVAEAASDCAALAALVRAALRGDPTDEARSPAVAEGREAVGLEGEAEGEGRTEGVVERAIDGLRGLYTRFEMNRTQ